MNLKRFFWLPFFPSSFYCLWKSFSHSYRKRAATSVAFYITISVKKANPPSSCYTFFCASHFEIESSMKACRMISSPLLIAFCVQWKWNFYFLKRNLFYFCSFFSHRIEIIWWRGWLDVGRLPAFLSDHFIAEYVKGKKSFSMQKRTGKKVKCRREKKILILENRTKDERLAW